MEAGWACRPPKSGGILFFWTEVHRNFVSGKNQAFQLDQRWRGQSAQLRQRDQEMGHPPDTHSARTPVGTTATPGLTPDLATPIPWLRWALVASAIVAGVLLTSCLLCTICCCRRGRHRKRPRDKEAVVLGTTGLTTTTHLVQPELGNVASGPAGAQQWGACSCPWSMTLEARR